MTFAINSKDCQPEEGAKKMMQSLLLNVCFLIEVVFY